MSKEIARETHFSRIFKGMATNFGGMALCMYQNGDGHGDQGSIT